MRSDFSFALVPSHSSTTTPLFYRMTALWSSQEGSLLLWVLLLSLWRARAVPHAPAAARGRALRDRGAARLRRLLLRPAGVPRVAVRRRSPMPPAEGVGLNPLLRHPSMMIHPPMLYSGYTLFAVPFAFAIGALVTRRLGRGVDPLDAAVHARRLVLPRHRDHARRALVVLRARLGRLLGLGPGGERVADAVADRHRVPALGDDPGAARDAEGLERLARAGDRRRWPSSARSSSARGSSTRSTPSAPRRSACRS